MIKEFVIQSGGFLKFEITKELMQEIHILACFS